MLDNETKRRINSLRDILVGKLPDPKAQVEQITNGLIYKFMNDMDDESVSMGGKATYFSGKFKKYSWGHLMDTKTSGIEKVSLYSEAIEQMYNNGNLPELFKFSTSDTPIGEPLPQPVGPACPVQFIMPTPSLTALTPSDTEPFGS